MISLPQMAVIATGATIPITYFSTCSNATLFFATGMFLATYGMVRQIAKREGVEGEW